MARCEILARAIPQHDARWIRSLRNAAQMFQRHGERPTDELVLDCVLVLGEMSTFIAHIGGKPVDEELATFDAALTAVDEERERAIKS